MTGQLYLITMNEKNMDETNESGLITTKVMEPSPGIPNGYLSLGYYDCNEEWKEIAAFVTDSQAVAFMTASLFYMTNH
jgi:hypothetical protein